MGNQKCPNCGNPDRFGDDYNDYSVSESCRECGFKRVYGSSGWVVVYQGKAVRNAAKATGKDAALGTYKRSV